jgi:hypothetical protein
MTEPLILPTGYGFRRMTLAELHEARSLLDVLCIYEPPRRRGPRRYILGVDVADGLGQNRSVVEVVRMGTIEEPQEQVAEYVSAYVQPMQLAYIVQAIGQYYVDADGYEALVAIECNNHGLSTQDTLQLHLGYTHFYRWEYYDQADPSSRFSTKIGWVTTPRTRPILLDKFRQAISTLDPVTGLPDFVTHSPILHEELKDFQTETILAEAEAAKGATDDCIMAAAIANYVSWRMQAGEVEPLEERRRRRSEQQAHLAAVAAIEASGVPDYRNMPYSAEEKSRWEGSSPEERPELVDEDAWHRQVLAGIDERSTDDFYT